MKRAAAAGLTGLLLVTAMVTNAAAGSASGIPGRWQSVGASVDGTPVRDSAHLAGRISAVTAIPGRPPVELAGTLGGIWRRARGGAWRNVTSNSWPSTVVNSFAVDPRHRKVVYAGTGYDDVDADDVQPGAGLLKSTDGGRSWRPLAASEKPLLGYAVESIGIDPRNDRVVVAAANNGVFRSTDGGRSWHEVLPIRAGAYGVAEVHISVDPVTGTMLVGVAHAAGISARLPGAGGTVTTGHAVFTSRNAGATWSAASVDGGAGEGDTLVPAIATSRGRSRITYAYALDVSGDSRAGLYISHDGRSWRRTTKQNVITKFSIGQLVANPARPSVAYFAQEDDWIYRYAFGARRTQKLGPRGAQCAFGDFRTLAIGPSLRAPAHQAVYGGHDGGTCYFDLRARRYVNNNPGLISVFDYTASATSGTNEVSGSQDLGPDLLVGPVRSREIYHSDAYGVLIDAAHPSTLYAAVNAADSPQKFVVSHDRGRTWGEIPLTPRPADVYGATLRLVQAQGDANVIVLPTPGGVLYVSGNDGGSWNARSVPVTGGDYVSAVRAALFPGEVTPTIYAGTGSGNVWRSDDLGVTWTRLPQSFFPLSVRDLLLDPAGSTGALTQHVYAALGAWSSQAYATYPVVGDVRESRDGGLSWTRIGQPLARTGVNALLLFGNTLLAGTDYGVERYTGTTWVPAGDGFPRVRVNDLVSGGGEIFAATVGRGTLRAPSLPR